MIIKITRVLLWMAVSVLVFMVENRRKRTLSAAELIHFSIHRRPFIKVLYVLTFCIM